MDTTFKIRISGSQLSVDLDEEEIKKSMRRLSVSE